MRLPVSFNEVDYHSDISFIQTECTFQIEQIEKDANISIDFGELYKVRTNDIYKGDYTVIPRVYPQVLFTNDKLMTDDVAISVIPLAKTKNLSNGYTVTIG